MNQRKTWADRFLSVVVGAVYVFLVLPTIVVLLARLLIVS